MKKLTLIAFFVLITVSTSFATPYYIANNPCSGNAGWGNGSNSNDGLSKASPFLTMAYATGEMSGGDTLTIDDGTYTGSSNSLNVYDGTAPPEGSSSGYTVVRADNTWGVIIDGGGTRIPIMIRGNDTNGGQTGTSASHDYIEIRGIVAQNSSSANIGAYYVNHVKFIDCMSIDASDGNASGITILRSSYCLAEGCASWGNARYQFSFYESNNSIFRNCVSRNDRVNASGDPMGGFIAYSSYNIEIQNCIDINSDQSDYWLNIEQHQGSFGAPATAKADAIGPVNFNNCIAIKNNYRFGTSDPWDADEDYDSKAHYTNCVGAGIVVASDYPFQGTFGQSWFNDSTFIDVSTESGGAVVYAWVNSWGSPHMSANDTVWANFTSSGSLFYDPTEVDNNVVYNVNGSTLAHNANSITVTNEKTYNPTTNGLSYIVRTETGSTLKTDGIGANIQYQYGRAETLYGETGYNLLQNNDVNASESTVELWPFPNEDIIKEKMAAYEYDDGSGGDPEITGARGFCAAGKQLNGTDDITLTSYIWEYLGNEIPSTIYGVTPNIQGCTISGGIYIK